MSLESCMILLDCSEYMRNGDYIPTRLEAQQDAANMLVGAKTQAHPESTVGVSAGTQLLVSPTEDVGKILTALHGVGLQSHGGVGVGGPAGSGGGGVGDVTAAVQVASLALKHRRNKNGSQRIVLFVGSPLEQVETRALQKAGRQLKKNNVAIDVVAMGELDVNEAKLKELVDAANGRVDDGAGGERTCHLVTIPPGVLPSDVLANSPILAGTGGAFAAAAASAAVGGFDTSNNFAEYGGVDPNMDPELAMALRVSMEEERARQERAAAAAASEQKEDAEMTDAATGAATTEAEGTTAAAVDMGLSEEEALLQQALAMSMNENEPAPAASESKEAEGEDAKPKAAESMDMDEDDDAAMQMALQMSMQEEEEKPASGDQAAAADSSGGNQFQDPAFVNQLLGSMPGVDPNDPEIQEALRKAAAKQEDESKEDGDESKKD